MNDEALKAFIKMYLEYRHTSHPTEEDINVIYVTVKAMEENNQGLDIFQEVINAYYLLF